MSIARRFRDPLAEPGRIAAWLVAAIAALALVGIVALAVVRRPRVTPALDAAVLRLAWAPPADLALGARPDYPFGLALAPDGRTLAFAAAKAGQSQLWLRDLSTGDSQMLPGTDDGVLPFWSPDGRALAFFARGSLKAITLENASVTDLAPAPAARGGVWHPNGDIIFAAADDAGLTRRRGATGALEPLTAPDRGAGEASHLHPVLVDGGRSVVFFVRASEPARQGLWMAALDRPDARKRLGGSSGHAIAIDDVLLFESGGSLVAQRLDAAAQALVGRPELIGTPAGVSPQHQLLAAANRELLIFGEAAAGLRELRWVDRAGTASGLLGEASLVWDLRLSPTGARVAVAASDPQLNTLDIWTYDGDRPLPRRISPAIDADESPVWSPDGTRLAWVSGRRVLAVRGVGAELPEETLYRSDGPLRVTAWSPDGQWIIVTRTRPDTRGDVWVVPAAGGGDARPYAQSPFNETDAAISPDGRWLAYASDESGRFEIYVDSFPAPGRRGRLTSGGGTDPRWSRDGAELYFRRGTELHVLRPALTGQLPEAAASDRLFDTRVDIRAYDVAADGQRFLLNLPAAQSDPRPFAAIVNWRALVPRAPE
jgi:hypothetical protein